MSGCHSYHSEPEPETQTPEPETSEEILRAGTLWCGAGDRVMAASLVILLYLLSSGYLVFWLGLWIVHIMAIIYG